MALTSASIYSALMGARASLLGPNFNTLALGISQAIVQWGISQPQNLSLRGVAVGTLGSGIISAPTTRIIVPPNPGIMTSSLKGAGVLGPVGSNLAIVVSNAISFAFSSSGQYSGVSSSVGTGSDTSKVVVANATSLVGILKNSLTSTMGAGPTIGMLSVGLGNGIAMLILQGTGVGAVTGVSSPFASSGVTTSVVM